LAENTFRGNLSYSPRFQALLSRSRQSITAGKGLSHEEFWQQVKVRAASERCKRADIPAQAVAEEQAPYEEK